LPLWFGELLVFLGFITGVIGFILYPPSRSDISSRNGFFSMCFQSLEHALILMFQLLLYYKLEHTESAEYVRLTWLLVFSPLFAECFAAMIISTWCIRHDRSFEFEMFFAANIVQFVIISFRLDNGLNWSWTSVFIPTWVLFSLLYVGSVYSLLISLFLSRSIHGLNPRRAQMYGATCHLLLGIPLLLFFLLLTSKLDSIELMRRSPSANAPYTLIGIPLFVSFLFLIFLSFGNKSDNVWWFAIRKPICNFLFEVFPCLHHYVNIRYEFGRSEPEARPSSSSTRLQPTIEENVAMINNAEEQFVPTNNRCPIFSSRSPPKIYSIETPD